jgi:hypothetical protein
MKKDDDREEKPGPPVRVGHLRTIGAVASELGRLYRAVRRGQVSTIDGYRCAAILNVLRQTIESGEVEQRLEQLEARAESKMPMLIDYKRGLQ